MSEDKITISMEEYKAIGDIIEENRKPNQIILVGTRYQNNGYR